MRRALADLPEFTPPEGILLKSFSPGDEKAWEEIIFESFGQRIDFNEFMEKDPVYKPERVLFLVVNGDRAATASAWRSEKYGANTGYLHMVGVSPKHQGKRFGYHISLAAMHKLKNEGCGEIALQTDDFRLAAIKTYLNLGFEPDLHFHESIRSRWDAIRSLVNHE